MLKRIRTTLIRNLIILDVLLFALYILILQNFADGWNPFEKTISQMVFYLPSPILMSFGFASYGIIGVLGTLQILKLINVNVRSRNGMLCLAPFALYLVLAFFPENKGIQIHLMIVWLIVISWIASRFLYAKILGDKNFMKLTRILIVIEVIAALITTIVWGPHTFTEAIPFVTGALWYLLLGRKLNHKQTVLKTNLPPLLPV